MKRMSEVLLLSRLVAEVIELFTKRQKGLTRSCETSVVMSRLYEEY